MVTVLLVLACSSPEPAAPQRVAHFGGFDALVRATAGARLDNARIHARDLTGEGDSAEGDAAGRLGAALGFVQAATAADDLPLGVAKAAAACGECHTASGVPAPDPPEWSHEAAAVRAAWGVVWGRSETPPDSLPEAVRTVWGDLGAVLKACQGCHAEGAAAGP